MLDPDVYLEDANEKQKRRAATKFPRQMPNFHKLNIERLLVPIVLDVPIRKDLILRDRFDWDLSDDHKSPYTFATHLGASLSLSQEQQNQISYSILEQIIEHIEKYTVQTRTRIPKRIEEQAANNLTCLQCDSILYNNDVCRACGVSLEKLRQKYGHLNTALASETREEDETPIPRQTERQRTLESTRRRTEPNMGGSKKPCPKCGEPNHILSIECRSCQKPLSKGQVLSRMKRPSTCAKAMTYYFWKIVNKDNQLAQIIFSTDQIKETDFNSVYSLYEKLKNVISDSENPPISFTPFKINQIQQFLDMCYQKLLSGIPVSAIQQILNAYRPNASRQDLKELDASYIHSSAPSQEYQAPNTYMPQTDYRKRIQRPNPTDTNQIPRKRGRPKKNPTPLTDAEYQQQNQEETEARRKQINDSSASHCGVCGNSHDTLYCCEVCPSVYHLRCLNLSAPPRGKWFCFFCRVVKDGLQAALSEHSPISESVRVLLQREKHWKQQALQILSIVLLNPCSRELNPEHPSREIPPEELATIKLNLEEGRYASLEELDSDIRHVFKVSLKTYKKRNQVIYWQIFNLQLFHNKIISELQAMAGIQINTQPINFPSKR